jgi:hypothetical protein
MQILILQAGVYNDARQRAQRLPAGARLVTGYDYALSLIASGLARDAALPEVYEPEKEAPAPDVSAETTEPVAAFAAPGRSKIG